MAEALGGRSNGAGASGSVPFNSERRWSALQLLLNGERRSFVLGAPETVLPLCTGGQQLGVDYNESAVKGLRGVVFAESPSGLPGLEAPPRDLRPLALVLLGDKLRPEVRTAFETMDRLGIEPKIISGDNPGTVKALLAQLEIVLDGGVVAGVEIEPLEGEAFRSAVAANSVFGRVSPALKARIVTALRDAATSSRWSVMARTTYRPCARRCRRLDGFGDGDDASGGGIVLLTTHSKRSSGAKEATAVLGNAAREQALPRQEHVRLPHHRGNEHAGARFPVPPSARVSDGVAHLGIPAVFISISIPPPDSGRDFTRNVLRWALPASLALAAAAITVHLLTEGLLDRSIEEARTLVSLTMGITGLFFMVEVLGFHGASWRSLTRPVMTTLLGAILVVGFLATVYTPWLREFFDFTEVHAGDWVIVLSAVAGALGVQYLLSRYWQEFLDLLTAAPRKAEGLRGRAI